MLLFLPVQILNVKDLLIRQHSVGRAMYLSPGVMITMMAMNTFRSPSHKEQWALLLNVWFQHTVFRSVSSLIHSGHGRVWHMPWKGFEAVVFE